MGAQYGVTVTSEYLVRGPAGVKMCDINVTFETRPGSLLAAGCLQRFLGRRVLGLVKRRADTVQIVGWNASSEPLRKERVSSVFPMSRAILLTVASAWR